jgi:hypothetical protein
MGILVGIDHGRQHQHFRTLAGHRHTNKAACLTHHQVQRVLGGQSGRGNQVTFIFPALVINDNDTFPRAKVGQCVLYPRKLVGLFRLFSSRHAQSFPAPSRPDKFIPE